MAKRSKSKGAWIDQVHASVGRFFSLETTDGVVREGKLTGIRARTYILNGAEVEFPTEIELNSDPTDTIPLERVKIITVEGL
jgi:hypothetical protein